MKAMIGEYIWQLLPVSGEYMWQWLLVQILWHVPYVFSSFYCLKNYYTSDICHLLISGVGVKIASDILCESDGCHCTLPVRRLNAMWQ